MTATRKYSEYTAVATTNDSASRTRPIHSLTRSVGRSGTSPRTSTTVPASVTAPAATGIARNGTSDAPGGHERDDERDRDHLAREVEQRDPAKAQLAHQ